MSLTHLTVAAGLAWALAAPPAALAQDGAEAASPLQAGLALYAAASYDEALDAFEAARQIDLALEDRVTLAQHRMLCLLALGRTAAAEDAAASLLEARPDFVFTATEASPRVRARFDETRRRVLPAVVRRVYTDAKRAYDSGEFTEARDGFAQLAQMLGDPQVASADPAFADLGTLADGFRQLSDAAIERRAARRDYDTVQAALAVLPPAAPAMLPMAAPVTAARPAVGPSMPPPFAPLGIFTYDWRDKDVAPPMPMAQAVSGWWGSMGEPPAGTALGAIEVVVDESGHVVDARIYQSVNRVYDAVLLESARQWRYQPAMKDGRAVKYRRIAGVVSGR
ncbi:MAG: energy transducer TonB [Acidobacteria bacterium]|nr:energy transducer TonB [Acidobacteriota bacterium]